MGCNKYMQFGLDTIESCNLFILINSHLNFDIEFINSFSNTCLCINSENELIIWG